MFSKLQITISQQSNARSEKSTESSSTSFQLSTAEITAIIENLRQNQHRDSTKCNYYSDWKNFNKFFVCLDVKPARWEDQLTLFVGHLINEEKKSATVHSYICAVKAVLKMYGIDITEDQYLLASLTRACKLKNDTVRTCLPIHRDMLGVILRHTEIHFNQIGQPYLGLLYRTIFSTMYYGLFRISEVVSGEYPVLARDVHIGKNKNKILFMLHLSKTHNRGMTLQLIKISSTKRSHSKGSQRANILGEKGVPDLYPCPYELLRNYAEVRGGFVTDWEPFFIYADRTPVPILQLSSTLRKIIKRAGFNSGLYGSHNLRAGRSCDLYKLGLPVSMIKKLGRWKSNVVYQYLCTE